MSSSHTCIVLDKTRAQSLKKILIKVKDTINTKVMKKTNIKIQGISQKQFTFTIYPIWPLYKQVKTTSQMLQKSFTSQQITVSQSQNDYLLGQSTVLQLPKIKNKQFLLNFLEFKFRQLRVNLNKLQFNSKVTYFKQNSMICDYIKCLLTYNSQNHDLKLNVLKQKDMYFLKQQNIIILYYQHFEQKKQIVNSQEFIDSLLSQQFLQNKTCQIKNVQFFLTTIYPSLAKRACLLRWVDSRTLQFSFQKQYQKQFQKIRSDSQKSKIVNRSITYPKTQASELLLSRYFYKILRQSKRIKVIRQSSKKQQLQQPFLRMNLNVSHKQHDSKRQLIKLDLVFSNISQYYDFVQQIKSTSNFITIKMPIITKSPIVKQFIQRQFCCKIHNESVSIFPQYQPKLKQFLKSYEPTNNQQKKVNIQNNHKILQLHLHQLQKILQSQQLVSKLSKIYYSLEVKMKISKDMQQQQKYQYLYFKKGDTKIILKNTNKKPSHKNIIRIPAVSQNIFQENQSIQQYLQINRIIYKGQEPFIMYFPDLFKTKQEIAKAEQSIVNLLLRMKYKVKKQGEPKQFIINIKTQNNKEIIKKIKHKLMEGAKKCINKKCAIEYEGTLEERKSIEEQIYKVLESKRIRLEDILKNISYKKKLEENIIKKEIHEILNVTKDNKLVIKQSKQFEKLVNYINIR